MPALADFLKTSLDDSLKKLVQPAGLIPATLLVLLNLAFVLPVATARKVPVAVTYNGLSDSTKVIVLAALIPLIGYVFANSTSAVLDLLCGRSWNASLIAIWFSNRRADRRVQLEEQLSSDNAWDNIEPREDVAWRLKTRYQEGRAAPTALGDVLGSYEDSVNARYGISLAALWEPLRAVVPDDDPAAKAVADERSSLDVSANLTFAGALFVFEAIVLFTLWNKPASVLLAFAALSLVYLGYRVTVAKAVSWCDAIDTVAALYISDLMKKLGTRATATLADRRELLRKLSDFLLRGGSPDGIFEAPAAQAASVTASKGVEVSVAEATVSTPGDEPRAEHRDGLEFVLLVSRTVAEGAETQPAALVFSDARLPRIAEPSGGGSAAPQVLRDTTHSGTDSLVWTLFELAPGEGRTLRFGLDRWQLAVSGGCKLTVRFPDSSFLAMVDIVNPTSQQVSNVRLDAFHCEDGHTGTLRLLGAAAPETVTARGRAWTFASVPANGLSVALRLVAYPAEEAA